MKQNYNRSKIPNENKNRRKAEINIYIKIENIN